MAMLFRRRKSVDRSCVESESIAATVRRLLALGDETTVSVNELHCGHAACGGVETVILVMRPGRRTAAFKVARPIAHVKAEDLAPALGLVCQEG
jgi:hypothetical protein